MKTEIRWIDGLQTGRLGIASRPRGGDWLDEEVEAWHAAGVDYVVSALTAAEEAELDLLKEESTCQRYGLQFISVPIRDRSVPVSAPAFRKVIGEMTGPLDTGQTVLVHCRQGIGRASLIAASILVMKGEGADEAFAGIQRARRCSVPDTEEQRNWVQRFATVTIGTHPRRGVFRRIPAEKVHA